MDLLTNKRQKNDSVINFNDFNQAELKYYIVEYAIGEVSIRHKFHKVDETIDVASDKEVFRSYFIHSEEILNHFNNNIDSKGKKTLSGYAGKVFADELKIDIDEKENSLEQVRTLLKAWEKNFNIDPNLIQVNFSGSKGFHVRIPSELFGGFEPSEDLPAIHKQIALELTKGIKIDETVYRTTTGLFREVNSINKKSGLYAIPLTIDEVFTLSYSEIRELAKAQRTIEYMDPVTVEFLVKLKENTAIEQSCSQPSSEKQNKVKFKSVKEGERFDSLSSSVGRLIRTNLSDKEIMNLGLIVNSSYNPPLDEAEANKIIKDLLDKFGTVEGDFWIVKRIYDKNGKKIINKEVEVDLTKYLEYLSKEGFSKIYLDKFPLFIRTENNLIREYSVPQIKDYVMNNISGHYRVEVQNKMLDGVGKYFNEKLLECIATTELTLQKDEKQKAYVYYKNGFVTLEKGEDPKLTPLSELKSPIWETSIIDREIKILDKKTNPSEFEIFLKNVVRNNEDRFLSLCSAIGYLLHDFKDESNAKAVILCDERISDEPNGRSGKSLLGKAIRKMKTVANIDGKNFEFKDRFTFQSVDLNTKVIDFNDVKRSFDFEKLFSVLTDDMILEYKNEKPLRLAFNDSPKIMISTNYTIKGNGGSYKDRMFEIEFSDYYNENHKPIDDFGHLFFQDWDQDEWMRFDNFMLECLQLYLDEGLFGCAQLNLHVRKLRDQTSPEFVEFAKENVITGIEYNLKELYERFKKSIGYEFEFTNPCPVKQNTFTEWLKTYSEFNGLYFNKRPSNGRQMVTLNKAM